MTAESFCARLTAECGVRPGDHVLAAVSGGADSVALLCYLCEVRERLGLVVSCAHMEHGIRGEASIADMAFVQALCAHKGVPFYGSRADVPGYARERRCGTEEAARMLRYAFLERTAEEVGAQHIALAHHAMDQAETVLLHAARGSDIRGLCAMPYRRGRLIRPLLGEMPQDLRADLLARGQDWREDETNGDVAYARNRIRCEALSALLRAYPGAVQSLCRLAEAAQRDERYFEALLSRMNLSRQTLVDGAALRTDELRVLDRALLGRLLVKELEEAQIGSQNAGTIDRIACAVAAGEEAAVNLQGGGHAYISPDSVCFIRDEAPPADTPLSLDGETQTAFGIFAVREAQPGETGDGLYTQVLDESLLTGCMITQRRSGDTLIPFGRHTPVKLKKLMIDAGVERPIRNSLPILRQGETILWAVGLRPSASCAPRGGRRLMVQYKSRISNRHALCGMQTNRED